MIEERGNVVAGTVYSSGLEHAIEAVYEEVCKIETLCFWWEKSESELLHELVTCILGSRVSYEVATAAASNIEKAGVMEFPCLQHFSNDFEDIVADILEDPISYSNTSRTVHYPFPKSRANYISRTVRALYFEGGSLEERLRTSATPQEARRWLIGQSVGIGPKQASLFLRNVGFTNELAILDSHVLRFMYLVGLMEERVKLTSSLSVYEMYESRLRRYAISSGRSMGQLDFAIWVVMRVYSKEVRQ